MRHQQRDQERNMRRGTYGEDRTRQGQGQQQQKQTQQRTQRREAHEGDEDRWQSSAENYYDESQDRGFGQADRNDHSYAEAYRGSRGQGVGSANYNVNRSYASGREDFGSNSRVAGGWNESSEQRSFYGKGPKGYKRSDERIKEDVHEVLTWNNELDASDVEVEVKEGEVSLSGTVSDRRMKRLAEELIEDISGVRDVSNQLKIKKEAATDTGSSEEGRESGKSASGKKSQGATTERH